MLQKRMLFLCSLVVALGVALGACAGQPATEVSATQAPATEVSATQAPAVAGPVVASCDANGMFDGSKYAKAPPYTVCFSNASVANAWRVAMLQNFEYGIDEAMNKGLIDKYYYTDANADSNKQIGDIEDLLTKGCDVLLISANTSDVVDPGAKKAMEAGVPVITLDRDVKSPENRVSYTDGNSCKMGTTQAEWLVKQLGGKGNIVLLSGVAGASGAEDRLRCAREVFAKNPDIVQLAQAYTDWSPTGGHAQMEAWITQFGDKIDGIWADSALQGTGAVEALLAAGMKVPPITGEDWALFLRQAYENKFPFIAVSFPNRLSYFALQDALTMLQGEKIPCLENIDPFAFTTENMSQYWTPNTPDSLWLDMLPEVRAKYYPVQ